MVSSENAHKVPKVSMSCQQTIIMVLDFINSVSKARKRKKQDQTSFPIQILLSAHSVSLEGEQW
jgi:hypothetical protein